MKSSNLLCLCALFIACSNGFSAEEVVVPNNLRFLEGEGGDEWPFYIEYNGYTSARYQQIYDASQFAAMGPGGGMISALGFRNDKDSPGYFNIIESIEISLSVAARQVSSLSPVFAENIGVGRTVVYGPAGLMMQGSGAGDVRIELSRAFYYNPTQGNLLMEVRNLIPGQPQIWGPAFLDATTQNVTAYVFAQTADATMATFQFTGGLVTQFEYTPIPEPGVTILLLFGGTGLWICVSVRRRRPGKAAPRP